MPTLKQARDALDIVINKSRIHLYKPIQIAEILYRDRINKDVDLLDLKTYRTQSRKWRDDICSVLLGRCCTSTAKFQDNLFEDNALPPSLINELAKENRRTDGGIEAYIYRRFFSKYSQISEALAYCNNATPETFDVKQFIDSFWNKPGLKRSIDKIYEIVVYSLFSTIITTLDLRVEISFDAAKANILEEFADFAARVINIGLDSQTYTQNARIYRVGVTNAADRGLDMFSNFGPVIQVKHLSLDEELAQDIVDSVSSDRIVIVCKDAEREVIVHLLNAIGWQSHIQSIVTESNLVDWYNRALRGKFSNMMSTSLLECLQKEIAIEFPSVRDVPDIIRSRNYNFDEC